MAKRIEIGSGLVVSVYSPKRGGVLVSQPGDKPGVYLLAIDPTSHPADQVLHAVAPHLGRTCTLVLEVDE